jgi:hypothetical protein
MTFVYEKKIVCMTSLSAAVFLGHRVCFFKTIPRLYLSGKFSFVVTARLDTRIEWFLSTKCMLLLLMSLPDLVASICSSPVYCCGCAVVLDVGGTSMLSFLVQCLPVRCCSVLCGFSRRVDVAKRQSMTSVGEVTAEE